MGAPIWYLVLALFATWVMTFLGLVKSVKSLGKVQYVTALFPYVFLLVLLIRGAMLPNAVDGILFLLVPEWSRLLDVKVWYDAFGQVFFSFAVATGQIVTLSSYNTFHYNVQRDAVRIAAINIFTSMMASCVVFSYLGYLAAAYDIPIDKVANSGTGLAFIVYPSAVTLLPAAPLWSAMFFYHAGRDGNGIGLCHEREPGDLHY